MGRRGEDRGPRRSFRLLCAWRVCGLGSGDVVVAGGVFVLLAAGVVEELVGVVAVVDLRGFGWGRCGRVGSRRCARWWGR